MKRLSALAAVVIVIAGFFSSCRKDSSSNWDTTNLVPLLSTNLSLQNLVKDSTLKTNADNSLTLAFKKTIYELNLANQIVHIPDTAIGQNFSLDSLSLPNQTIIYNLTMGALANNMLTSTDPQAQNFGGFILNEVGQTIAIPSIPGFTSSLIAFDGSQFFQKATLSRGTLTVGVNNYFPIPLQNAVLELRNSSDNALIIADTLPYLAAHDSVFQHFNIAGKTVEGHMNIKLANISSPGSNGVPVLIDTNNYIKLYVSVSDLRASDAIAVFPSQDLVSTTQELTQTIADRKLTYIDARQGQLHVKITSAVQQPLKLTYILEGAFDRSGSPLVSVSSIPAAQPGQPSSIDKVYDVSGYSINLTGKDGTKFNTYTQTVIAHTESTGLVAHITQSDSLRIEYRIENIAPNYIKGYAGRDTVSASDSADFSFLNIFKSGSIDLQSVNMNLSIENGIGIDGVVKINNLTAISPTNGTRTLTGNLVGQNLTVHRATDFPLTPAVNDFALNNNNSNIKDLLGILPNKLKYDVSVRTNVNGNNQQYRDFIYLESAMKINLNAEIPLSLIASHLLLKDTIAFDLSSTNTNINGIKDGTLNLLANNKFPIEAVLTIIAYDENWVAVDTLTNNTTVAAADINSDCRVTVDKKTKLPIPVSEERMTNIKKARHAIITADFSTVSSNATCNGQHLKIYSDYALGVTFTAKFNYKVGVKF